MTMHCRLQKEGARVKGPVCSGGREGRPCGVRGRAGCPDVLSGGMGCISFLIP